MYNNDNIFVLFMYVLEGKFMDVYGIWLKIIENYICNNNNIYKNICNFLYNLPT